MLSRQPDDAAPRVRELVDERLGHPRGVTSDEPVDPRVGLGGGDIHLNHHGASPNSSPNLW